MSESRKQKIAYIVSMHAGLETFIYREVDDLVRAGKAIRLYATRFRAGDIFAPKPEWSWLAIGKTKLLLMIPWVALRMLTMPRITRHALKHGGLVDLYFAILFAADMRRNGITQIHAHFGDHKFFIGYYCKRILDLPLSVTIHAHEFYTNPNEALFREALAAADRVFPIARKWMEKLGSEYGVERDRLRLNRLFVDTERYRPQDMTTVIAVGRYTERKGFQYLIEALKQLKDTDIHVLFIGFGDMDLAAIAREHGVEERVTVFGKMDQDQLRLMYQMADILCVPSITTEREGAEGIPVVLMEGMACGLPVVATPCGAIEELVDEILVPERDVDALAEALCRLAGNPELRRQQGERNREKVCREYSMANIQRFGEWLDELSEYEQTVSSPAGG